MIQYILLLVVILLLILPAAAQAQCSNISSLTCTEVRINPNLCMTFDGTGGMASTGFTMVDPPSSPLTTPSDATLPGYEPSLVSVTGGHLFITSTKGIMFRDPSVSSGTNSQVNAFGIGFAPESGETYTITTTIINPNFSIGTNSSQQAGIWLGLNENNYVKLDVLKVDDLTGRINLAVENYGASATGPAPAQINSPNLAGDINTMTIALRMVISSSGVTGYYSVNGGAESSIGPLTNVSSFFDGTTLPGLSGVVSYAGLYTTHRSAASGDAITFDFDTWCISEASPPATPTPTPTNTPISTPTDTPPSSQYIDGWVEETDTRLVMSGFTSDVPLNGSYYAGGSARRLTATVGARVTFQTMANTIVIYRTLADSPAFSTSILCVSGVGCDPAIVINQWPGFPVYRAAYVSHFTECGPKTVYFEMLNAPSVLELDAVFVLTDPECVTAPTAEVTEYPAVHMLATPANVSRFADVNGQTVSMDHTISAGEVIIVLSAVALWVVAVVATLLRRVS